MKNRLKKALISQDGRCTFWFNGWWKECCVQHDYDCADAWADKSEKLRFMADAMLEACVNKQCRWMGTFMYRAIRMFLKARKKLFNKGMY